MESISRSRSVKWSPSWARAAPAKTTLANLVPRFYDVSGGAVRIDGKDVRDIRLSSLRENISIVAQDTFLFNDTVFDNIAYGRPDAKEDEVFCRRRDSACARVHSSRLPDGYQTLIGERGLKLSGGQRQRVAIARALLKDAPILILDEATSHLDTESERLVQQALTALMKRRTVFVIAHRLSTIRQANKIVVLEAGKIAEIGTHDQLLAARGVYYRLHEMQHADVECHRGVFVSTQPEQTSAPRPQHDWLRVAAAANQRGRIDRQPAQRQSSRARFAFPSDR